MRTILKGMQLLARNVADLLGFHRCQISETSHRPTGREPLAQSNGQMLLPGIVVSNEWGVKNQ